MPDTYESLLREVLNFHLSENPPPEIFWDIMDRAKKLIYAEELGPYE